MIEVRGLSYRYPGGERALEGVSFAVRKGEAFAVVGPNGSGKTTLLLSLMGLLKFRGEIRIFGHQLNGKGLRELRRSIGFVFQDPDTQLFMPTVGEDVAFGPQQFGYSGDEAKRMVKEALRAVRMEGYEGRFTHRLSYGEKKKIALATALVLSPEILIFDEPTSNLDPASRREFLDLIGGLNCTRIFATHDMDMVRRIADRVLVLFEGRKAAECDVESLFKSPENLRKWRLA
ncbi:MAG: ABC transporter ATP-binding protein [Candidatus Hydrothermae bacterium]|nr:ABC transporter ATP-binding protein [Candidatus Hydrothermae bacterium]